MWFNLCAWTAHRCLTSVLTLPSGHWTCQSSPKRAVGWRHAVCCSVARGTYAACNTTSHIYRQLSCHVISPSSTVAGNKTSDNYIFTVARGCSPLTATFVWLFGSFFNCFINLFSLFFVLWYQQLYFYIKFEVATAVNIKIMGFWIAVLCRLVHR